MSDNPLFSLVICEGVHDVRAVCRILDFKGFREAEVFSDIPGPLRNAIPRQYPVQGNDAKLTWLVTHPSFLFRNGYWVLVSNAGGESKLGTHLSGILPAFRKEYADAALRGIAILADADTKDAAKRKPELLCQLRDAFRDSENFEADPSEPERLKLYGNIKPLAMYIFPDNQGPGTLETVLLAGAGREYPELLSKADEYVAYAETCPYAKDLSKNCNREKATVGVIANALRPGRANQTSIQDNKWFTKESLAQLPLHRSLSDFIDLIISWENP
ncbi:MAG: hypothetical protein K2O45_12860 [Oscillospiraceae bacterium]|nr:hypothetical protein [Oscillospiraceae bacterium]